MDPAIAAAWAEHMADRFPPGYGGEEVQGIDLAMLDADVAGCVECFLHDKGRLDSQRIAILGLCYAHLMVVVPLLSGTPQAYFARLHKLAEAVLRELAATAA